MALTTCRAKRLKHVKSAVAHSPHVEDISKPNVRFSRGTVDHRLLLLDDNALPHRAQPIVNNLKSEDIHLMG
ncbi:hypothetical protein TNCV_1179571 [Trichonephila clavipes]|nr:hypothetical protein TNCV_1179571 [Trichonephila clavipes]